MTLFEEIIAFLFLSALKFYWPLWLQQHIMLNFLFLKPSLSSGPCLQSFLFLSLVPETKTRMLAVILDFSTPTIPIQLQDCFVSSKLIFLFVQFFQLALIGSCMIIDLFLVFLPLNSLTSIHAR